MSDYGDLAGASGKAGHAPLAPGRKQEQEAAPTASGPESEQEKEPDALDWQRTAGNSATAALLQPSRADLVRAVVSGPGTGLDPEVAETVSEATGADTSDIRVHVGPDAAEAAHAVQADMFASGSHIVAPDGLEVSTAEGLFKAVHEVHHIVNQQAKGPVEGTETGDGLKISDPGDRHEQEADQVAAEAVLRRFGGGAP